VLLAVAVDSSTTSIPTWLLVLVPILAALVSGLAGVAGALLGGRAATGAAERTASLAHQDEQRRWNREHREDAYRAFLADRDRYLVAKWWVDAIVHDAQSDPKGDVLSRMEAESVEQWRALGDTLAQVDLFGSLAARESARTWVMGKAPAPALNIDEGVMSAINRFVAESGAVYAREPASDAFLALVRKELGVGD
jgi:hypothetical protein